MFKIKKTTRPEDWEIYYKDMIFIVVDYYKYSPSELLQIGFCFGGTMDREWLGNTRRIPILGHKILFNYVLVERIK